MGEGNEGKVLNVFKRLKDEEVGGKMEILVYVTCTFFRIVLIGKIVREEIKVKRKDVSRFVLVLKIGGGIFFF